MTQLIKDTWSDWGRKVVNVVGSAAAIAGFTAFTTYASLPNGQKDMETALVAAGTSFFGAIVQHLRSRPS